MKSKCVITLLFQTHYLTFQAKNNVKIASAVTKSQNGAMTHVPQIGLRQLCQHNFEHNRLAKALSIMQA